MAEKEYIEREAFLTQKREQYCKDCARRKGMRNGKYKTLYEIGEAPCRACGIDDVLNDVEDFPAADVRPVVHGEWGVSLNPCFSPFDGSGVYRYRCNQCRHIQDYESNFCPNCGADMRQEPT